jgi:hypothetical protein
MHFDIEPRPEIGPTDLLCINRKLHDSSVKPRQSAFVDRFKDGAARCGKPTHLVSYQEALHYPISNPWNIRGMKFTAAVNTCWSQGRNFYYIDNGYIGNVIRKIHFRIIKDHVHDIRPIIERPRDRLEQLSFTMKKFSPGSKILIAPPSEKSFSLWNINQQQWIDNTVAEIKQHTDRPIEIRLKRTRDDRMRENTMEEALADDVHCLVTYNSVAACEAVMLGKPAITLGPNAVGVISSQTLAEIENPRIPTEDEREAWLRHLSYSQFTFTEMSDGTAWRILTDHDTGI